MFGSRRRQQPAPAIPNVPLASGMITSEPGPTDTRRQDLHIAAEVSTLPMPLEVSLTHSTIIVYVSHSVSLHQAAEAIPWCITQLARDASTRGCTGVYGVQHQIAVTNDFLLVTMIGTGALPNPNPDGPPGATT